MRKSSLTALIVVALFFACFAAWMITRSSQEAEIRDYPEIAEAGVLRVAAEYRPLDLHVEKDTLVGFHYELLMAFAAAHGLEVQLTPEMDFQKQLEGLESGHYDLLAESLLISQEYSDTLLALTDPIFIAKQVLVQRKATSEEDSLFIHNQLELDGKTLYLPKDSPVRHRIHNLSKETGDSIFIEEEEKYGTEQLVAMVAAGDIDYTVCDQALARALAEDYPQLDITTAISFNQFYAWGLHKHAPVLLDSLNSWLARYKQGKAYKQLLKKYKK